MAGREKTQQYLGIVKDALEEANIEVLGIYNHRPTGSRGERMGHVIVARIRIPPPNENKVKLSQTTALEVTARLRQSQRGFPTVQIVPVFG